ncbi:MAG: dihydrofolate reductase [Pseudomonadota bacterium]|jgi:dihydrofolate reductase|nr:MAG: dihydrofolate reductase [Pseudomonadota bacterium]
MSSQSTAKAPLVSLVVAVSENGVIGRDNALPWHLPADLRRFKALTMGKPMLMGRRTYESIGRPLPGRTSLVLTRDPAWSAPPGVIAVRSIEEALERVSGAPELAVIGGEAVFRLTLPLASRIYLTRVHAHVEGDVRFPELDPREWREVESSAHPADERHPYAMTFVTLERVTAA